MASQSVRRPAPKTRKKLIRPSSLGFDWPFMTFLVVILTIGLIMLYSASHPYAYYWYGDSKYFISRQIVFALLGLILMIIISQIDYHILYRFAFIIYGISILLLVVVLFMRPVNNARRWIFIGPFNFQPSEIAKFALILVYSYLVSKNYKAMKDIRYGFFLFLGLMAAVAGLMVLEPHMSGTIIIITLSLIMMYVGGAKFKWFAIAGSIMVGALVVLILNTSFLDYARSRLEIWRDPFIDPRGKGYQTIQSLYAIGSGGLMGTGIGGSKQKYLYVPEPQNDFVFSIVCEELGFIGAIIIISLFIMLIWRGFVIAMRAPDKFGSMLALGLTLQVGLQVMLNIAVVTNTVPNTGISLPFFSSGGTSLVMMLAQMGIILSISRQSSVQKK